MALIAKATVYLQDLGIGEGDRIGVALTNSADHIVLAFALLRLGAVLVELSIDDSADALAATARKYGIRTVFTEAHAPEPPGIARIRVDLSWRSRIEALSGDHRSPARAEELQIVLLTTGSTGVPSGLITTQRQFICRVAARRAIYAMYGLDRVGRPGNFLLMAPIRYGWFFVALLAQVSAGGPLIALPEYAKGPDFLRAFASWDDAICYVTANMCRYLIEVAPQAGLLLPNMRLLESGGLPLFAEEKRAMIARVTPNFFESYGTAGIGMVSALPPAEMATKADSVGRPAPGVTVEIVDRHSQPLPSSVTGTIRCRSASMSLGECAPESGAAAIEHFADGWYYPGDAGFLDADGYLHLQGRVAEIIRRRGAEIFAPEIEAALAAHPAVAEVAVIGRPIAGRDDEIVAFVVKRGALTHEALVSHCHARLVADRRPDRIYYAEVLPRIAGGKINRVRLLELAADETRRRERGP